MDPKKQKPTHSLPPRPQVQNQKPYPNQPPPAGYQPPMPPPGGNYQPPMPPGGNYPPSMPPPGNYQPSMPPPPQESSSGLAIAGMILGIAGILGSWIPFLNIISILIAIIGLILSLIALKQCREKKLEGRGMAIAGLILSSLTIIISIIFLIWGLQAVSELQERVQEEREEILEEEAEEETENAGSLQQLGQNTQRTADIQTISSALRDYAANNASALPAYDQVFKGANQTFDYSEDYRLSFYKDASFTDHFKSKAPAALADDVSYYIGADQGEIDSNDKLPSSQQVHIWVGYQCKGDSDSDIGSDGNKKYSPDNFERAGRSSFVIVYTLEDDEHPYRCQNA